MGVKVRGTCPSCGHVVDTEAPRDRVTWRGACPTDGCTGRVLARRVEQQDQGAAEQPAPAADPAPRSRRSSVPRVGHGEPAAGRAPETGRTRRGTGDGGGSERPPADVSPAARPGTTGDPDTGTTEPAGPGRGRARAPEPDARPVRPYGHLYSFD